VKNLTDPLRTAASANLSAPHALSALPIMPALPTPPAPARPPAVSWRHTVRDIARNLVISGALPLLIYFVMTSRGASTFVALVVAAIPPALDGLYGVVRRRRIDLIAALVLAGIVVSIVAVLLGGNPRVLLVRESFFTGALGAACFVSLALFPRPLMFYFGRYFATGDDPAKIAEFNALWQYPYFRHVQRLITLVWGAAYIGEFVVRVGMAASALPIPVVLGVSPVVFGAITVATMVWTFAYARRAQQHGEAMRRAHEVSSAG
jgi:hypothetical protein